MDLADKVVIVTGATRGIGRRLAIEAGRRGARVAVVGRTVDARRTLPGTLAETAAAIAEVGGTALNVKADVAQPADLEHLVAHTVETFGGIDVVVNNAADMIGGDFEALLEALMGKPPTSDPSEVPADPYAAWLNQFAINVHAPYLLATLATPHLRARGGGIIINVTSESAELVPLDEALRTPAANPSVGYGVTKAALNRLTNATAAKLAADRIAVVAVDPGVIHTEARDLLEEAGIPFALAGAPVSVAVDAILRVITADDPMVHSGRVVRAQPLLSEEVR